MGKLDGKTALTFSSRVGWQRIAENLTLNLGRQNQTALGLRF